MLTNYRSNLLSIACLMLFFLKTGILQSQSLFPAKENFTEECVQTITWKFGFIDPRFDLNEDSLKNIVQSVSDLWSEAAGYTAISYSPSGDIQLNFYYTDHQQYTEDEQALLDEINRLRQGYYSMNVMYQRQKGLFEKQEEAFNIKLTEYNANIEKYNETLSRTQMAGIRTRELDEQLKKLSREIEFQESDLAVLRDNLYEEDRRLQELSDQLNRRADRFNELAYQYKKRFGRWRTFYQGSYLNVGGKQKINIYQFDDMGKLKLLLAHEFGHALGLSHVGNPESIMYYLTERQNTRNLQLSEEDIRAIELRCVL